MENSNNTDDNNNLEARSSNETGKGFIHGITFESKEVIFSIIDGEAIFEGDIILGKVEELEKSFTKGIAITGQRFRWPNGVVPYTIDSNLPDQARITNAIRHWETVTMIRFVRRGTQQNYITFRPGSGCSSRVGMIGNQQFINLCDGCSLGNAIHEIGHAIGLWHEQSREDRNNFVRINVGNITPGTEHNFNQQITDGDDVNEYDYCSIMHYGTHFFSSNGQPTITVVRPNLPCGNAIGQRNGLSDGDKAAIAYLYFPFIMAWKGINNDQGIWFSSFNGTSWAPQQNVQGVGTSVGPSLAVYNGRLYMAWKGISNDQGIWFSSFNGTSWAPQQNVQGVGTSVGPSLAVYNGRLYMAWKGISNDQGIWFSSFNGTSWAPQQNVQGVGTSVGPSLAVYNGRLYMAWKGISNDQGIWFSSFNGTSWAPQQNVQGVGTSVGPSLAVYNGRLYMAWKGISNDQGIWFSSFNGTSWAPQQNVQGVGTSVGPSLSVYNNGRLYMAWKGISNDQGIWFSSFNGTSWAPQQNVQGVGTSYKPSLVKYW